MALLFLLDVEIVSGRIFAADFPIFQTEIRRTPVIIIDDTIEIESAALPADCGELGRADRYEKLSEIRMTVKLIIAESAVQK